MNGSESPAERAPGEKQAQIVDAVLTLLGHRGIGGVSMRAVAREAGVALGLTNYYFTDKTSMIAAALRRIGEDDARLVDPEPGLDAEAQLLFSLRRVADDEFLRAEYLALRLQLWSLARVDPTFARINHEAQEQYRDGLAALIAGARPEVDAGEAQRRASDVLIIQNGMWLTSILIIDPVAIARSVQRCEEIALG